MLLRTGAILGFDRGSSEPSRVLSFSNHSLLRVVVRSVRWGSVVDEEARSLTFTEKPGVIDALWCDGDFCKPNQKAQIKPRIPIAVRMRGFMMEQNSGGGLGTATRDSMDWSST
jgi:hypothetical protein